MNIGEVYLVGAGPGDPGLLTVKAHHLIASADCIVYDHLVNPDILSIAPANAELIYAGKQRGKCAMRQETINALLVAKACEYDRVVRLKGGDPFVFGRGGEEAEALASAGIPWQVVPGISAGAAVPAYAGIPITHRGLSSSVVFVTGHEDPAKPESSIRWEHLAKGADTIVLFMGSSRLAEIAAQLISHGRNPHTPVAILIQGTCEQQSARILDLHSAAAFGDEPIETPAMIVIGEVVRLREKLEWFSGKMEERNLAESLRLA